MFYQQSVVVSKTSRCGTEKTDFIVFYVWNSIYENQLSNAYCKLIIVLLNVSLRYAWSMLVHEQIYVSMKVFIYNLELL